MNKEKFINELSKLHPSATFLTLSGYRNESSEIADYSLVFHISYENALKKSLLILNSTDTSSDLESVAKQELIEGYQKSLDKIESTSIEDIGDAYTRFYDQDGNHIKGVKLHIETDVLHLYGLVAQKRILMPGIYPTKNKRPLTLAKDKLRKLLPVNKFRQFMITPERVNHISVQGLQLLPPDYFN